MLIATTLEGELLAWDMRGDVPMLLIQIQTEMSITALALSPDGRLMATGHRDGTVQVWGIDA